jgi:tetratricopeptide (TPR) repeat protein
MTQSWQPVNPVERRFAIAHEDWLSFAHQRDARVLYWQTDRADGELVRVYFQAQRQTSSAVLELTSAFEHGDQYAMALADEIVGFYMHRIEGSRASGIIADWMPPPLDEGENASRYLLKLLHSLMQQHPDVFPGLVLLLMPERRFADDALERWLEVLLQELEYGPCRSDRVRIVLSGVAVEPLPWLRAQRPQQVKLIRGRYHMKALPRELLAESGERGPSGQFRRLFVELTETLEETDPARLERLCAAALKVSAAQRWFDQSAVVHLLAGAAYLKLGRHDEALASYQQATGAARDAQAAAHPAGGKLVINGLFGEAGVHWLEQRYAAAARCYAEAAHYAHVECDGILAVEASRMQASCLAKIHELEPALMAGFDALRAGQWIEPALRTNSNLRWAAQWMLEHVPYSHERRGELNDWLAGLYGENWPDVMEAIDALPADEVSRRLPEHHAEDRAQGAT